MAPTTTQRTLIIAGVIAACGAGVYALGTTQAAGATTLRPVVTLSGTTAAQTSTGVTVTGTGNATGTPNELQLSLSVNTQASSVGSALGQANQAMSSVRAALESHGVATGDLQTSGMSIQPNYVQGGTTSGYQATESLTATLRDLNNAGGTVSAAVSAGGNAARVDGVSLDLNDPANPLVSAARASAMADAKSKAQQYAAAAGESLGSVIGITETPASTVEPYLPAAGSGAAAGPSSVPVSSGSQQVSVTVTVTYALG
jgi:uncharacterized protein YggE